MVEVFPRLWVGDDADYERVKDREHWAVVRTCKDGPGGHRQTLGYKTPAAPKDDNYLFIRKGRHLALNLIDADDPHFIDPNMIDAALEFIKDNLTSGEIVLVACNQGRSRSPSIVLLYLRSIGQFPYNLGMSERYFRTYYPDYAPAQGIRQYVREHWSDWNKQETFRHPGWRL